jgi:hypothetical protein
MKAPVFTVENIPAVMREAKRWFPVALEWDEHRQKWTKRPLCKWGDEGHHRKLANVRGYAGFIAGGGFVTVDWDDCVVDGIVNDTVLSQVRALDTYAEISVSGKGVHAVAFGGPLPPNRRCEMWDSGHYVVMTGWHIPSTVTTVERRQDALVQLAYRLTPGGMIEAERTDYVAPREVFKKERTAALFRELRSLKVQGDSFDGVKAFLRVFDRQRCRPSKIAEAGERWYDDWFRRSWHLPDRFNTVAIADEIFKL